MDTNAKLQEIAHFEEEITESIQSSGKVITSVEGVMPIINKATGILANSWAILANCAKIMAAASERARIKLEAINQQYK